jgi:hypothetical protein
MRCADALFLGVAVKSRWIAVAAAVAFVVAGCAAVPVPTAKPSATGWAGLAPRVVCDTNPGQSWHADASGSQVPDAVTLTCDGAVAAAEALVAPTPMTARIEFSFGKWCPNWGEPCGPGPMSPNTGYVVFRNCVDRLCAADDLVVVVTADDAGRVTAAAPQVAPKPSGDPSAS